MRTIQKLKTQIFVLAIFAGMTAFVNAQEQTQTDVKDAELEEFADIYQKLMMRNQEVQQELMGKIEDEGLSIERYQELREVEMDDSADVEQPTTEELDKKGKIDEYIAELEPQLQKEHTELIEKSDLGTDRYNEIAMALQTDQELQQKIQQILIEKTRD